MTILRIGVTPYLPCRSGESDPSPNLRTHPTFISITIYLLYSIITWQRLLGASADLISPYISLKQASIIG